jgi:putative DNA primase/helicase
MPFISLDQITPRPIEWLWPGRLALGHLHMLDGDPGLGKSLVVLDLAARLTTGQPFPDGAASPGPANVVIINAEDGARDTIPARLTAAAADMPRVTVWDRSPGEPWLRLPSQIDDLDALVGRTHAKLVHVDPLLAFIDPGVNVNSDPAVRTALGPLADLAQRHRCAVVLNRHLNKTAGRHALYRGLGSIAFTALCRIGWFIGTHPSLPQFILTQPKNNLDPPQPSLSYVIETHASGAAHVHWLGDSIWTHDEILSAARRRGPRLRAGQFLTAFLKDGPRLVKDIGVASRAHGLATRTVERAAKDLNITTRRIGNGKDHHVYWLLPGQQLPVSSSSPDDVVEQWLRKLEAECPPRDALERAVEDANAPPWPKEFFKDYDDDADGDEDNAKVA